MKENEENGDNNRRVQGGEEEEEETGEQRVHAILSIAIATTGCCLLLSCMLARCPSLPFPSLSLLPFCLPPAASYGCTLGPCEKED
jgi:hypothetical protein